jgi:TatD DNase family protein
MYADSHCHLTMLDNPDAAVRQAREAGVSTMLTICTNFTEEADDIVDFSVAHEGVWCALGTHPHAADTDCTDSGTLLQRLLSTPKAVAVGETGLDFYYKNSNKESQKISFAKHIEASLKASLPLVIHSRAAEEDTLSLLQSDTWRDTPRGVMHCFTGSADPGARNAGPGSIHRVFGHHHLQKCPGFARHCGLGA